MIATYYVPTSTIPSLNVTGSGLVEYFIFREIEYSSHSGSLMPNCRDAKFIA